MLCKLAGMADNSHKLLTTVEAAEFLNITPRTLIVWRSTKRYPIKYAKIGGCVRYRISDLEAFVDARTRGNEHGGN